MTNEERIEQLLDYYDESVENGERLETAILDILNIDLYSPEYFDVVDLDVFFNEYLTPDQVLKLYNYINPTNIRNVAIIADKLLEFFKSDGAIRAKIRNSSKYSSIIDIDYNNDAFDSFTIQIYKS